MGEDFLFYYICPRGNRHLLNHICLGSSWSLHSDNIILFHLTLEHAPCHAGNLLRDKYIIIPSLLGLMQLPLLSHLHHQPLACPRVLSPPDKVHVSSRSYRHGEPPAALCQPCRGSSTSLSPLVFRTCTSWESSVHTKPLREI